MPTQNDILVIFLCSAYCCRLQTDIGSTYKAYKATIHYLISFGNTKEINMVVSISHLLWFGILASLQHSLVLGFTITRSNINTASTTIISHPHCTTACYGSVSKWNEEYQQSDDDGEYLVHYPWAYILQIIFGD